jgi:hypothetical protein
MKPRAWFQADRKRVVDEYRLVQDSYPAFTLTMVDGRLAWEGETSDIPPGVEAEPLRFRIEYPTGFPAAAIRVMPLSPELPAEEWGHKWHRWGDGRICIVHPDKWDFSYTARDTIEKVIDWYFNYLAFRHGLIGEMPDVGRAVLALNSERQSA